MKLLSTPLFSYVSRNRNSRVTSGLMRLANLIRRAYYNSSNHDVRTNGESRILEFCYKNRSAPSRPFVVFDVGANNGEWTSMAAEICPQAEFHLFEIVPATCEKLRRVHSGKPGVTINELGLSNTTKEIQIRYYPEADTGSSEYALPWGVEHELIDAKCIRGDDYLSENKIDHIDYLKIDVEGSDYKVLQGFESALDSGVIEFIQFEYNKAAILSRTFLRDFYELLEANGYHAGLITPTSVAFGEYNLFRDETLLQSNFFASRTPLQENRRAA